ncbi:MAG: cytochrome d ubiquinol oxidase subunit II, partial [Acidimicrobiia bacterium]|nr:cytochrome d ubiquinol oxidase subunit II [Acidimicrobiia bacterium]
LAGAVPLARDAPTLFDGLTGRGLPLVVASVAGGSAALILLRRGQWARARYAAVVAVAAVVAGWGFGQYPWLLVDEVEIEDAAGAPATLWGLVITFGLATVLVLPPLGYLLWLADRQALSHEVSEQPRSPGAADQP